MVASWAEAFLSITEMETLFKLKKEWQSDVHET